MTDFLTRLAERTLGLTPSVQPLLASRYAPGPAASIFPDTLDEQQASPPEPLVGPTQAPTPLHRESPVSTLEPVLPRAVSETHAIARTTRAVVPAPLAPDETARPATLAGVLPPVMPETRASSRTTEAVAKPSLAPDETPGSAASCAESDAAPSAKSLRDRPSQPARPQPVVNPDRRGEPATASWLSTPAVPEAIEPANQSVQHPEEPHAVPLLLSPAPLGEWGPPGDSRKVLVRPVVERAASRAEAMYPPSAATLGHEDPFPPTNEPGPPVIRVTIGRIEVRAIMPRTASAARPAPTRTPPVLSLDDYLKQRSEAKQ